MKISSVIGSDDRELKRRVVSAAILVPVVLGITYVGGWPFVTLCAVAAAIILWEWTSLVAEQADARILVPGFSGLFIAATLVGFGLTAAAAGVIVIEAALAGLAMVAWPHGDAVPNRADWAIGGVLYAGVALIAPATLRLDPDQGLTSLLFLFATVWITDIFAYFCGRLIGGPLLWPQVSPNKTWAGAIGGLAGGVAAGIALAYASGIATLGIIGVMAFVVSVLTQAGDLLESAIKRRFGAKDAGGLIPGHGGLMDRVDGLLIAALGALVIGTIHAGTGAAARGFLVW